MAGRLVKRRLGGTPPPPRKGFKTDYLTDQNLRCVAERTFVLGGLESGKSGKSVQNVHFVL